MRKANKTLTRAVAWMTAVLMAAGSGVIASAEEALPEEPAAQTETAVQKKVLPRKGSKVKAVQDYKTHTVGSIQFQFPASGEIIEEDEGKDFIYKDPYEHVQVYVEAYDKSILSKVTTISYSYQVMLEKLANGCDPDEEVNLVMDKEGFFGLEYQYKSEDKVSYVTYLEGEKDIFRLAISADKNGMDAAKEYKEVIQSSLKPGKPDLRTIIRNPELDKIKIEDKYKTVRIGDIQFQVAASSQVERDVFQGEGWLSNTVGSTRFKDRVADRVNEHRDQVLVAYKHPQARTYAILMAEENGGMVPEKLSDRKLLVSDLYEKDAAFYSENYPDTFEISYRDDIPGFIGYQYSYKEDGYSYEGESWDLETYMYNCALFGEEYTIYLSIDTEEEGKEATEEYFQRILSSIKDLNPSRTVISKPSL